MHDWRQQDDFIPETLERLVRETFVANTSFCEEVGSTNDWALDVLKQAGDAAAFGSLPHLFLCDRQTSGRGRGPNTWQTSAGALTFSLVVLPPADRLPPARWPILSLAVGVAIVDAMHAVTGDTLAELKWPNDVYLSGRKAAGILIEAPAAGQGGLVIGVGVNVSNSFQNAPPPLCDTAVSLLDATGQYITRPRMLHEILRRIEHAIDLAADQDPWLIDRANALHLLQGRTVQLALPQETVAGRVLQIDQDGGLCLQTERGVRRFRSGTIASFE